MSSPPFVKALIPLGRSSTGATSMLPLRIAHASAPSSLSNLPSFCQASSASSHIYIYIGQVLLYIGHRPHRGNFVVVIVIISSKNPIRKVLLWPCSEGSIRAARTDESCHRMLPPYFKSALFFVGLNWVGPPHCRAHSHSHSPSLGCPHRHRYDKDGTYCLHYLWQQGCYSQAHSTCWISYLSSCSLGVFQTQVTRTFTFI